MTTHRGSYTNHDDRNSLIFIAVVMVLMGLFIAGVFTVVMYTSFPGQRAEIEAVRYAMERVTPSSSEDVYGQAVEMNRMIESYRAYNAMPIIGWIVPNGWDDIDLVPIPEDAP